MSLKHIVQEINKEFSTCCQMEVGSVVRHPDGYMVKIISGALFRNGRVSNHWSWKKVRKDGSLTKKTYSGYGW